MSTILKYILFMQLLFIQYVHGQLLEGIYCGEQNCYDILEVTRESSKYEISKSYRQLAKKTHPDLQRTEEGKKVTYVLFNI